METSIEVELTDKMLAEAIALMNTRLAEGHTQGDAVSYGANRLQSRLDNDYATKRNELILGLRPILENMASELRKK